MYSYRISKYLPQYRRDDFEMLWTSISDIGKQLGGKRLSYAEFNEVEARYLCALHEILMEVGVLSVRAFEVVIIDEEIGLKLKTGDELNPDDALRTFQHMLREELWCHLENDVGFAIDVGYDFYFYITSPIDMPHAIARAEELGLYVESDFRSFYYND